MLLRGAKGASESALNPGACILLPLPLLKHRCPTVLQQQQVLCRREPDLRQHRRALLCSCERSSKSSSGGVVVVCGGNVLTKQASPFHSPLLPLQAAAWLCPQEWTCQAATVAQLPGALPAPAASCTPSRCSETGFKKGMGAGC